MTDDDPVCGPALEIAGLDRQQCAVSRPRMWRLAVRGLDRETLIHLDRILLPILQRPTRLEAEHPAKVEQQA